VTPEEVESAMDEVQKEQEEKVPTRSTPGFYRAYSNIQFLGGATIDDKGKWILNGTRRDIGIFGSRGTTIATNKAEK